jgi:hypothetical protein
MNSRAISYPLALATLLCAPLTAWANANPDFDDDAKPILSHQPGLVQYVESRYEVKDTGKAKYPGDDDRSPAPPYIFSARPAGSHGPYNLRLLIQPGPPGHILGVVDITKTRGNPAAHSSPPAVVAQPAPQPSAPPQEAPAPVPPQPAASAPVQQEPAADPSEPSADTPSGPIKSQGSDSSSPSLQPPPDPAPATH